MSSKTTYLEDALINHVLRNTALASPATVYIGLLSAITDAEAGTVTEVTGGSYARQSATFAAPTDGVTQNSAAITFNNMPTTDVVGVGIYDALSAGNLLYIVAITTESFTAGDVATFNIGDITVTST